MHQEIMDLVAARRGHFRLESGHHGDLWLDLAMLCARPRPVGRLATLLAERLRYHPIDAVCGPLVEGAFVALMVASELGVTFAYTEPQARPQDASLYPVGYRLPPALRERLRGQRVAIVNDVTNAGSAVRGTLAVLRACGAQPTAIGSLLVLGALAAEFAATQGEPLETLATLPNRVWVPEDRPLCAAGMPLDDAGS